MARKKNKGCFSISAVAKMFSVHQQTIRLYEKEGLIAPRRSEGNTRLFAEEDVQRLEEIIHLTHTMGINLAGVEMVLKLKKQIKKLQKEMNALFKQVHRELDEEAEHSKTRIEQNSQQLILLKQKKDKKREASWILKQGLVQENSIKAPVIVIDKKNKLPGDLCGTD